VIGCRKGEKNTTGKERDADKKRIKVPREHEPGSLIPPLRRRLSFLNKYLKEEFGERVIE